jgi:hypothetical protein
MTLCLRWWLPSISLLALGTVCVLAISTVILARDPISMHQNLSSDNWRARWLFFGKQGIRLHRLTHDSKLLQALGQQSEPAKTTLLEPTTMKRAHTMLSLL